MHLLISGIPASGKSTFCKWLEEKKGFLHLDVEEDGVLDRHGLATVWDALFAANATAAPFVDALDRFRRPVAIDWGFPPECIDTVRKHVSSEQSRRIRDPRLMKNPRPAPAGSVTRQTHLVPNPEQTPTAPPTPRDFVV